MKRKFVIEFDEIPPFIFVSKSGWKDDIYVNGELVRNWRELKLHSGMDVVTNYTLDCIVMKPRKDTKEESQ